MNSMTHKEAMQEAQRRWGESGRAYKIRGEDAYQVGRVFIAGRGYRRRKFVRYAIGRTYEDAFKNVDSSGCIDQRRPSRRK